VNSVKSPRFSGWSMMILQGFSFDPWVHGDEKTVECWGETARFDGDPWGFIGAPGPIAWAPRMSCPITWGHWHYFGTQTSWSGNEPTEPTNIRGCISHALSQEWCLS
jgi:hypothetical protein